MSLLMSSSLRSRLSLGAVVATVTAVLAGCASGAQLDGRESVSPSASVSATVTPTPTPTLTPVYKPASSTGRAENVPVPALPEAAKANSKEGAEAFTAYWFQVMGYAYETGDIGPLTKLTGPNCEMCEGVKKVVPNAYTGDRWLSGGSFSTPTFESNFTPHNDGRIPVIVQVIQSEIRYWGPGGIEYRPPGDETNTANVAFLRFIDGSWMLDSVNPLA
ncbi:DUF6318 family protein [Arthrobacter sp. NyZ413]|uniref:DUF6318 family protein n=1 Tax=Arthrobacter sp. NyZ413 TaxID=3144669 RepID=UPI002C18F132|nr:DUF6318 family protein [Arthrobacter sp.]